MTVHGSLSLIPANTDNHVIDVIVQKQPQENPACLLLCQPPQNAFFPSISVCKAKATENCSVMRREHYMFVLDFNNAMGFAEVPCYSHRTDWDCATGGIFFFPPLLPIKVQCSTVWPLFLPPFISGCKCFTCNCKDKSYKPGNRAFLALWGNLFLPPSPNLQPLLGTLQRIIACIQKREENSMVLSLVPAGSRSKPWVRGSQAWSRISRNLDNNYALVAITEDDAYNPTVTLVSASGNKE